MSTYCTPANLTIGQEIVLERSGSWEMQYTLGYTVIKITKTRVIVKRLGVEVPRSFTIGGYEVGKANDYSPTYISHKTPADVRNEQEIKQRKITAARCIEEVRADCRSTYGKDSMIDIIKALEEKLAVAKTAVEAI